MECPPEGTGSLRLTSVVSIPLRLEKADHRFDISLHDPYRNISLSLPVAYLRLIYAERCRELSLRHSQSAPFLFQNIAVHFALHLRASIIGYDYERFQFLFSVELPESVKSKLRIEFEGEYHV